MVYIKLFITIIALALSALALDARTTKSTISEKTIQDRYFQARDMITNKLYTAAAKELIDIIPELCPEIGINKSEAEAYLLQCQIALRKPNIDAIVHNFVIKYPQATEKEEILLQYASYYFSLKDYAKTIEIIESLDLSELSEEYNAEYYFILAYCQMRLGNNEVAIKYFREVMNYPFSNYNNNAIYYSAYIHHITKRFEEAIPLFKKMTTNPTYSKISLYYLLESHFMIKDYDYVILNGRKLYEEIDREYKLKTARLLSEAYFEKDMPEDAKMFFEIYSTSGINLTIKDTYYSGIISYTLKSYLSALESFKQTINTKDTIGQSSYFYMGNCYLKLRNKIAALEAYKNAAILDFDSSIKDDSFYNYAKLAFDLNSDISVFNSYLNTFPSSEKSDEISNYIATSYLLNKNYKLAVDALTKISNKTEVVKNNLQKAAFFMGIDLLNKGAYRDAITYFTISNNTGNNNKLRNLTQFWLAEAEFRSNNYINAIQINQNLLSDPNFAASNESYVAPYNLGYAYLKAGIYDQAEKHFKEYLDLPPSKRKHTLDAKTRLADSYFMQRNYDNSAELYEEVSMYLADSDEIYPMYQSAISYGLIYNDNKKIDILNTIRNNYEGNPLYGQSLYELGRALVQIGNDETAIDCFNQLKEYSDSSYHPMALLELGMTYYNMSDPNKAIQYYKTIVQNYKNTEEAQSALIGIENIYQNNNEIELYFIYLDQIGLATIKTDEEKENMLFNSAEKLFLTEKYEEAIGSLETFINIYPAGERSIQANFYLAESLKNIGRLEEASDIYKIVMISDQGTFPEIATLNYANITYDLSKYEEARMAYENLLDIAKLENNLRVSKQGIIKSTYKLKDFEKTIELANSILKENWLTEDNLQEITYILAKSLHTKGEREVSKKLFITLAKNTFTPEGAESAYILIQDAYETGDFLSVENKTFAFSESKTGQTYWLAKSFIALGDSYAERGEWKQAKATFDSILEGYTPKDNNDDVMEQVTLRLKVIQAEIEKNTINNQESQEL